ncbi:MAG: DNA polymerase III subunit delta [Bacteroidetes bacterium]|nr:DNA polymerase III subunit delta [Bacteroidota bacterium]
MLANQVKIREFSPVYFLQGEETYYIDKLSSLIEETVLKPEEKGFNQSVLYGKDVKVKDIIMAAKRYPMGSEYQVIIVKEAQNLHKDQLDDFISYLENPLKSTILVINYKNKKIDQRTKVGKLFQKYAFMNCDRMYDNQVPMWIENYIKSKGLTIQSQAAMLIAEYLGNDLSKIENEIEKMLIQLPKEVQIINTKHIEENIGISKDFNVFELQKAIGENNYNKSIQIINYFANDPAKNPLLLTISNLFSYFNKILLFHEFKHLSPQELASKLGIHHFFLTEYKIAAANYGVERIDNILSLLKYYDLKSKGVGGNYTSEGDLMRELVIRIFSSGAK